jgi:hypothetical protein
MQWRESLETADAVAVDNMQGQVTKELNDYKDNFAQMSMDQSTLKSKGWTHIQQWQFYEKLSHLIQAKREGL